MIALPAMSACACCIAVLKYTVYLELRDCMRIICQTTVLALYSGHFTPTFSIHECVVEFIHAGGHI